MHDAFQYFCVQNFAIRLQWEMNALMHPCHKCDWETTDKKIIAEIKILYTCVCVLQHTLQS